MCGIGHTSSILVSLFPDLEVVGADSDFVNLFLARKFTAPGVVTLCIDAEVPLPFADASVDGLFCLDGFHYIRSKVALLRQVDRIVSDEASWVFAHMHNALDANINPGTPLSPKGYSKRFVFGQQRLLSESEILGQFQAGGFLDLTEQAPIEAISSDNALTLIGARTDSMWRKHLAMDDLLFRRYDLLEFNPLYRVEVAKDELILRAKWPTESLRRECTGTTTPLPELVHLPFSTVEEVKLAKSSKQPSAGVRQLIRSFVLVVLPVCYARVDFQVHTVSTKEG
jgi:SAM-dependent methyltransferase